jgi:hypothetical protein
MKMLFAENQVQPWACDVQITHVCCTQEFPVSGKRYRGKPEEGNATTIGETSGVGIRFTREKLDWWGESLVVVEAIPGGPADGKGVLRYLIAPVSDTVLTERASSNLAGLLRHFSTEEENTC